MEGLFYIITFVIIGLSMWGLLRDRIWTVIGVSALLVTVMIIGVANAGNIYENKDRTKFMFTGKVEQGNSRELLHVDDGMTLYMESPGGDAWESLQIGYIIKAKELHVTTYENKPCDSACAFAAIMGKTLKGTYGFHAPYPKNHVPDANEMKYVRDIFERYMKSSGRLSQEQINLIFETTPDNLIYFSW